MKTNKGFASLLIVLAVVVIASVSVGSYYLGKHSVEKKEINNIVQNPEIQKKAFPTFAEVKANSDFKDFMEGGGSLLRDDLTLSLYVSSYFPFEKAVYVLGGRSSSKNHDLYPVYDVLEITLASYCANCNKNNTNVDTCIYNKKDFALAVHSLPPMKVYQAWKVNLETLKFEPISDIENIECSLDEGVE
jgi:hypothetical protein